MSVVFLISPARCGGPRARQLAVSAGALGVALRGEGAAIGDVFAWLSALYFRGKLAYAQRFAPATSYVMAPGAGLLAPDAQITAADLAAMATVEVESEAFTAPLVRDVAARAADWGDAPVVLLGSIATGKYVDALCAALGDRLVFPEAFVGRGDMSRGGLLLRAARDGDELVYRAVAGATRRGTRPPKLPPRPR